MASNAFPELLVGLAAEYGRLEDENLLLEDEVHKLKSLLLQYPPLSGDEDERMCRESPLESSLAKPDATEIVLPCRVFLEEAAHATGLTEVVPMGSTDTPESRLVVPQPPDSQAQSARSSTSSAERIFRVHNSMLTNTMVGETGPSPRRISKISTGSTDELEFGEEKARNSFFSAGRRPIFANIEDMKDKVRAHMMEETYNVADMYHNGGFFSWLAQHPSFENMTLVVIFLNALWIAIDTDHNKEELLVNAHWVFQVAEHTFCIYFTSELFVRFLAFMKKGDCLRDAWFMFDSGLVLTMVLETWVWNLIVVKAFSLAKSGQAIEGGDVSVLRIARLIRLTRIARMARLLKAMPELVILLKGMQAAARSVFFTLVLLVILLYVFAIAFTQLLDTDDVGQVYFHSVIKSMETLWLYGALLDEITRLMEEIHKAGIGCAMLMNLFILCSALTVMNMLVGVLCEVVSAVAKTEKEEMALSVVKAKVQHIFFELGLDDDNNGMISKDEFQKIIQNREAARAIQDLGVDVVQMVDMAEVFFTSDGADGQHDRHDKELSFSEFMDTVIQLRGSNFATVKDLVNVRNFLSKQISKVGREDARRRTTVTATGSSAATARAAAAKFLAKQAKEIDKEKEKGPTYSSGSSGSSAWSDPKPERQLSTVSDLSGKPKRDERLHRARFSNDDEEAPIQVRPAKEAPEDVKVRTLSDMPVQVQPATLVVKEDVKKGDVSALVVADVEDDISV